MSINKKLSQAQIHSCAVIAKIGKNEFKIDDETLGESILNFIDTTAKIRALNENLKELKAKLSSVANELLSDSEALNISLISASGAGVKIGLGFDIKIEDKENLREILGDKFDLLVKTKISYEPEKRLREMALIDDGIKECLIIKEKAPCFSVINS